MKIVLSEEALEWFHEEMDVEPGDEIKFFARYGGASPLHEGFSLGIRKEGHDEIGVETKQDGVLFYIEKRDEWFFSGHDLHVTVNPQLNELHFSYEKA
ncbi:hypothetical protein NCCP2222_34860 [Sporosarcina sp. NCCP-2222]|uniref:HesB/YadR/YfhF family protein n=1 Tax=Sporosarcina sp. NCCP-2222 TaxID=2935073 RepID=UPI00208140C0|nr:HesB/YadR/YfhF family protein [Sporosarcina sp. NCCP-2222]GKV57539.1 hypothetical protein NCCP2222_34860 [Sporosarcina sp. NCCP-2222]